ncbi:MAG: adenylate/guanylate cyclase domain-containing protein [bacterium]|nr:adenylate/guanylate cyclase domain-containing protein [bacterium]
MNMQTKNLTVMFTDIKGFTDKSSNKTRDELMILLDLHDKIVRPIFGKFGGKVIKTIGDAFLVIFESPTDAVLCGMQIQKSLRDYDESNPEERLEVRVAINSGEVTIKDKDVFGEAVNIAARIEGIAEENEIYFTEAVYLAMNKQEVPSAEVGYRRLKGIPNEIKVYKVVNEKSLSKNNRHAKSGTNTASNKQVGMLWRNYLIMGAIFIAAPIILHQPRFLAPLFYIYMAYALFVIAKKIGTQHAWLAWIPIVNVFYTVFISKMPKLWILFLLIPLVNIVVGIMIWMEIAGMRNLNRKVGLLMLVPILNFFIPGYIAMSDN